MILEVVPTDSLPNRLGLEIDDHVAEINGVSVSIAGIEELLLSAIDVGRAALNVERGGVGFELLLDVAREGEQNWPPRAERE